MEQRQGALEGLVMFLNAFQGKRVWVSGTTGFKGSWLAEWLLRLGAEVYGLALPPDTTPALFEQLKLRDRLHQVYGDIRDPEVVRKSLNEAKPDFVFHLAAQALVRESYAMPVETFDTNVMGTVHVLEALRALRTSCVAVMVTTDKCYENREWHHGYREDDPLGGRDPYSASKAAAEMAIAAYRHSFFTGDPIRIASVRAGNVIGGGDWAANRIVPDCVRALSAGAVIPIRNPSARRPWQHVLEPLSGYLWLAAAMACSEAPRRDVLSGAFNFGPRVESNHTVVELAQEVVRHWPGRWENRSESGAVHEARLLHLSIDKAYALLDWFPVWDFATSVEQTIAWYRAVPLTGDLHEARDMTVSQIDAYVAKARARSLAWAEDTEP